MTEVLTHVNFVSMLSLALLKIKQEPISDTLTS